MPDHEVRTPSDAHFSHLQRLRARGEQHARDSMAARQLAGSLMSLGAVGSPVLDPAGHSVGELREVFVNWTAGTAYPPMTAIVIRAGHPDIMISARWLEVTAPAAIRLRSTRAYARAVKRQSGDVALVHDVLDHQVVDAVGTQVVRPSDVYLAAARGRVELVGIEIGLRALLRRLGPKRPRGRIRAHRVIDWGSIHGFAPRPDEDARPPRSRAAVAGQPGAAIALDRPVAEFKPLGPAEAQSALRRAGTRRAGDAS